MSMKERLAKKSAAIGSKSREPSSETNAPNRQPSTGPGQLFAFMGQQRDLQEENARLKLRIDELEATGQSSAVAEVEEQIRNLQSGKSFMAKLSALQDAEGGRRNLSDQEFAELRENLRLHPLIHPISVRRLDDERLEIISGHNRAAAYRDLGRDVIPATFIEIDDTQAADAAFFANLLQPKMPDYEKFLNLKRYQMRHPDVAQNKIAQAIGVDRSLVTRLLSFEDLPTEALQLITANPRAIGCNLASNLVGLVKDGLTDGAISALKEVIAGRIDQSQAVEYAKKYTSKPTDTKQKSQVQQRLFRSGNSPVCELRTTGSVLRIDIKDKAHVENLNQRITQAIEQFVASLKN